MRMCFRFNILVVGGPSGFVELYAYGLYKIARLQGVRLHLFFVLLSAHLALSSHFPDLHEAAVREKLLLILFFFSFFRSLDVVILSVCPVTLNPSPS